MVLLGAALGHRSETFTGSTTLGLVAAGVSLALVGAVTSVAALRGIWRDGRHGFRRAATGLILAVLVLAYPAALVWRATTLPALSDISTDLDDPPRFGGAPGAMPGSGQQAVQRAAYPEVVPRHYEATAAEVFAAVLALVSEEDWVILRSTAPSAAQGAGDDRLVPAGPIANDAPAVAISRADGPDDAVNTVDGEVVAVARTGFMGFEEDVAIRVRADDGRITVDMRSASRTFDHDFGSNARRIADFLDELDDAMGR